ncbi:MAG: HEAT repeat domain-containing protein [Methanomicrobiales archaeon]|nr:HEAT repeat domain-containing protein [Methanomicrobiales archaeon]
MRIRDLFTRAPPDVDALAGRRDIDGLVRALGHRDTEIQLRAARALGTMGTEAVDTLIRALETDDRDLRLGVITAMGEIRDPAVLDPLLPLLHDRSNEVRWAAALALGQLGDPEAVPLLVRSLRDPDRYVRYGAAIALGQLGWRPEADEGRACLALALQDWDRLSTLGKAALPALQLASTDRDREVRARAVALMGQIGDSSSAPAVVRALGDPDDTVRWNAVLAAKACGVPPMQIPRGVARRPRVRKDPRVTALLNFLLPGLGYFYLGKWWGILIWQVDITATVWLFTITGEAPAYAALLPIYLILAAHGYYMATRMPDL